MSGRTRRPHRNPADTSNRRTGRHPAAERTVVRFTDAAVSDLEAMVRKGDPQVVRWALKKCLMLERNPEAGEALVGALIGYRKLTLGDRDWPIVWRVTFDDTGHPVVDVAEVWALGARSNSEVYAELHDRVTTLSADPEALPLAEVIERLGRIAAGISPANTEPATGSQPANLPDWLRQALIRVVGLPPALVEGLSEAEARRFWEEYTSAPH